MRIIDRIALIVILLGALNWGAIGVFGFDVVHWLTGGHHMAASRIIFTIVGLAGIWSISLLFREREEVVVDRDSIR